MENEQTDARRTEPVSRDQILRRERGQRNIDFPCSADHEQDWQPCPVDPYSAICDNHIVGAMNSCKSRLGYADQPKRSVQYKFKNAHSKEHNR